MLIKAGTQSFAIRQSRIPKQVSGQETNITFNQALPAPLVSLLAKYDIPAQLACSTTDPEWILIKQGTYNRDTRNCVAIRGISQWANRGIDNEETKDFSNSSNLFVDFSESYPAALQDLSNNIGILLAGGSDFLKDLIPAASSTSRGVVYTTGNSSTPLVVSTNGEAIQRLYESIFGSGSKSLFRQTLSPEEQERVTILQQFIDLLQNKTAFEKLKDFLNV